MKRDRRAPKEQMLESTWKFREAHAGAPTLYKTDSRVQKFSTVLRLSECQTSDNISCCLIMWHLLFAPVIIEA